MDSDLIDRLTMAHTGSAFIVGDTGRPTACGVGDLPDGSGRATSSMGSSTSFRVAWSASQGAASSSVVVCCAAIARTLASTFASVGTPPLQGDECGLEYAKADVWDGRECRLACVDRPGTLGSDL